MYAFHLFEAIAFFDETETFIRNPTEQDLMFRDQMQRIVMDFVKRDYKQMWLPYPEQLALVDANVTLVANTYAEKRCHFWESQGLTSYVWVS